MSTDRNTTFRGAALLLIASLTLPLFAQDAAPVATYVEPWVKVDSNLIYALFSLLVIQVIFIASLASIMRTLGGPGGWIKKLVSKRAKLMVLLPALLLSTTAVNAQAFKGGNDTISTYHLFWLLVIVNAFLFIIMMVQLNMIQRLTRTVTGADEVVEMAVATGPSWLDRLLKNMTKQVEMDQEKDILLDHEYDGIRELDNVLPPWWLWLFYGSIAWGVMYMIAMHGLEILPEQNREYKEAMAQAAIDVAAYKATLTNVVDESNVTLSTEANVLGSGKALFTQFCTPCHGADGAGSETSVGPNLTDGHWIHGGGIQNVFKTIKYGVPEKGMISWKAQLQPAEISALSSYIISLQGTGPATQKAPEGELWKEPAAPTDSTATPKDTLATATASVVAGIQ